MKIRMGAGIWTLSVGGETFDLNGLARQIGNRAVTAGLSRHAKEWMSR